MANRPSCETSEAVMESDQDNSNVVIVVVGLKRNFYIPRRARDQLLDRGDLLDDYDGGGNVAEQLPWSVEETCKFASGVVVLSKC